MKRCHSIQYLAVKYNKFSKKSSFMHSIKSDFFPNSLLLWSGNAGRYSWFLCEKKKISDCPSCKWLTIYNLPNNGLTFLKYCIGFKSSVNFFLWECGYCNYHLQIHFHKILGTDHILEFIYYKTILILFFYRNSLVSNAYDSSE